MANAETADKPAPLTQGYSPTGAVLSYLVPGLGQIHQGRFGKGVLFLVCLYGLFFYGMYLGSWQNVYVPQSTPPANPNDRGRIFDAITDRARFAGQFWIGAAAWPAILQYVNYKEESPNMDLAEQPGAERRPHGHPWLGTFMRMPDEEETNKLLRDNDKKPDLGWMYTVIAGVLNILVIYDAFAGPAFGVATPKPPAPDRAESTPGEKATP